jgi:predicted component of type VI protein secretion system
MQSIESLQRPPYRQMTFVGNEHGMHVTVDRNLFASHRRWFLGIHKGSMDAETVHRAMSPGNLDWKMGSQDQVERLFTQRSLGVEIKRCSGSPAMLPKGDEWLYYEVIDMERSPWKDVESTGTLSIRFGDTILLHRDRLPGQRSIQVQFGSHTLHLQFALFGVA